MKVFENHCPLVLYIVHDDCGGSRGWAIQENQETCWVLWQASCLTQVHPGVRPALQTCLACQNRKFCLIPVWLPSWHPCHLPGYSKLERERHSWTWSRRMLKKTSLEPWLRQNTPYIYSAWNVLAPPNSTLFVRLINTFINIYCIRTLCQVLFFQSSALMPLL